MSKESPNPRHVYLIDGSGFLFRAYYGIKERLTRADGTLVNAVHGFSTMLMKLIDDTDADYIAVIFDSARKTFRNDIYPKYKANRDAPPADLIPQFELVREATRAFNVACVDMPGFEADDLIATYATQAIKMGAKTTIVSSDKDLMQLVDDNVMMFDAMKNKEIRSAEVVEKFGVTPDRVTEVQALAGDSSDNVPGVPGIGLKTAALLVNEYGDLDGVLDHAEEVKQPKRRQSLIDFAANARLSKKLVTLKRDVPVKVPLSEFVVKIPDQSKLLTFLAAQNFKNLADRATSRYGFEPLPSGPNAEVKKKIGTFYELVQDVDVLKKWINGASFKGFVAIDTETTSIDATQAKLVGISLSYEAGQACYIPLSHKTPETQCILNLDDENSENAEVTAPEQINFNQALKILEGLLSDPSVLKIGHNIKYDAQVLASYGIQISPFDDTMLLSYVLDCGRHAHNLDELSMLHFDHKNIKFKDIAGSGKSQITFDKIGLEKALDYAAEDADMTWRLFERLKPQLVDQSMVTVYETLERPLIGVLTEMERRGIKVDAEELKRLSDDFAFRLSDLEKQVYDLAGREFNVASPKQLGEVLFDEMGLPGGKKGKTGAYATGVEILEKLATDGHQLPRMVLEYRQLAKLKSTYTDALTAQINPTTGRVHTSFSMAGTSTGRLASSNPNLQNIPVRTQEGRKIREAFIPEVGCKLLSADYSQIELRLLAHVAGIDTLVEAFRSGEDIHAITASQVFGVSTKDLDPMLRRQAKAINFGIIYGISSFGLARQLDISKKEASDYIKAYFERYPGILDYMQRTKEEALSQGYVTTLFGRKCHIKGIDDKNPVMRSLAERAAINAPIQGGAADIIKRAMVSMPPAMAEAGLGASMLLQVHDELIFEVPKKEIEVTTAVVKEIMQNAAKLDVPLIVDVGIGDNWNQAH